MKEKLKKHSCQGESMTHQKHKNLKRKLRLFSSDPTKQYQKTTLTEQKIMH